MKDEEALIEMANQAMQRAYAPYSHLRVGAAVVMGGGKAYSGCNVENAAFPTTICAERTAISKGVSEGHRRVSKVVITSDAVDPLLPCGMCLQMISEFARDGKVQIVSVGKNGKKQSFQLGSLFPSGVRVHKTIRKALG